MFPYSKHLAKSLRWILLAEIDLNHDSCYAVAHYSLSPSLFLQPSCWLDQQIGWKVAFFTWQTWLFSYVGRRVGIPGVCSARTPNRVVLIPVWVKSPMTMLIQRGHQGPFLLFGVLLMLSVSLMVCQSAAIPKVGLEIPPFYWNEPSLYPLNASSHLAVQPIKHLF